MNLIYKIKKDPSLIRGIYSFTFSILLTVIFYLPALKNASVDAGFLYTGDVLGWYLPALIKTHSLLHHFEFSAIDYSAFNGSSDFFLSPNFFAYHPAVVIYSLIFTPNSANLTQYGHFLVLLYALHTFAACYFALKLSADFFKLEFGASAFVATIFAFSMPTLNALGQPPIFFCATIVPWAAYAALKYSEKPSIPLLLIACLPVILGYMGGYMPMGVAGLALSALIVLFKIFYFDASEVALDQRFKNVLRAIVPFVLASIIVSPYLYSVLKFHLETTSIGTVSLFYSAHQLAQLPQTILHIFSKHYAVSGRVIEFPLTAGFIALIIAALFFFSSKTTDNLAKQEWKLFIFAGAVYFVTVLSIFGDYSVISDLVYYLIPQVGKMHLYERFLLPAHLLFGVLLALMLKALIDARPTVSTRIILFVFIVLTLLSAYLVGNQPDISKVLGLNNYLVFEFLVALLFICTLFVPNKNFVYFAAIIFTFMLPLDRMYDDSMGVNTLDEQRKIHHFSLNSDVKNQITAYLKTHTNKKVIKYIDITPMWSAGTVFGLYANAGTETFPKVFSDYVLDDLKLSSYGGFTFYLSARADYMHKMPVVGEEIAVSPDWEYLKNTGADFLVATEQDLKQGAIRSLVSNTKQEDILRLPNEVVILPLRFVSETQATPKDSLFDNGYFKISHKAKDINNGLENIALGKPVKQSSDAGADPKRAVDGNTDGEFSHGSASHTLRDINAWFEVDLGKSETIDSINIWNRTDCCGYCLRDYWIFISDLPFKAEETATKLSMRPATWHQQNFAPNPKGVVKTVGAKGRYVRIQLPGDAKTLRECFLSLAEVEIFKAKNTGLNASEENADSQSDFKMKNFFSNHASYLNIEFTSSVPTDVAYLFWNNPRLSYYLNGKEVQVKQRDGVTLIEAPAGKNKIEIRYRHWHLRVFWVFYSLYFILLALATLLTILPKNIKKIIHKKI